MSGPPFLFRGRRLARDDDYSVLTFAGDDPTWVLGPREVFFLSSILGNPGP